MTISFKDSYGMLCKGILQRTQGVKISIDRMDMLISLIVMIISEHIHI